MKDKNFKPKILIVDDEKGIRDTLYYNLIEHGFKVETAPDGNEAFEKIKKTNFHVVLSDIVMKDCNGISLLKKIKEYSADLPVILFTGYASMDTSITAVNKGAFAYMKKPVQIDELVDTINKAVIKHFNEKRKNKLFKKYLKKFFIRKQSIKEKHKSDGIKEDNIEIPADFSNYDLIKKHISVNKINKTAKIIVLTKHTNIIKNVIKLFHKQGFINYKVSKIFNTDIINRYEIIIIDTKYFEHKLINNINLIENNKIIIPIINKNQVELKSNLKKTGIDIFLTRPVGFQELLKTVLWHGYTYKNEIMKDKIDNMSNTKKLIGNIKFVLMEKVNWKRVAVIFAISIFTGIIISSQFTINFLTDMKFDKINSSLNHSFSPDDLRKQFNPEYKKNVPLTIESVKYEAEKKLAEYNYYKNEISDSEKKVNTKQTENQKKETKETAETENKQKTSNNNTKKFPILKPD